MKYENIKLVSLFLLFKLNTFTATNISACNFPSLFVQGFMLRCLAAVPVIS